MANRRSPWWNHGSYPKGASFAEMLDWHLSYWGTQPGCSLEHPNTLESIGYLAVKFHEGVPKVRTETNSETKLNNWRKGKHPPTNETIVSNIFTYIFGEDERLAKWKADLSEALMIVREKNLMAAAAGGLFGAIPSDNKKQVVSAQLDGMLGQSSAISDVVISLVNELTSRGILSSSDGSGSAEEYFGTMIKQIVEMEIPADRAEEQILLGLLKSGISDHEDYALNRIFETENASNRLIESTVNFIFSQRSDQVYSEIRSFLKSDLNNEKKYMLANTLCQNSNWDARYAAVEYLTGKKKLSRDQSIHYIQDADHRIRLTSLRFFFRDFAVDEQVLALLIGLLDDKTSEIRVVTAENLIKTPDLDFFEKLNREQRYVFQLIMAQRPDLWEALIEYSKDKICTSGKFLQPLFREIAQSADREIQNLALAVIPEAREEYVKDLVTKLKTADEGVALRAAYRLGYPENKSELAMEALLRVSSEHPSPQVRNAAHLAHQRLNGNEAYRNVLAQTGVNRVINFYPLHEINANFGWEYAIDMRQIMNLIDLSDKFDANSFLRSAQQEDEDIQLSLENMFEVYSNFVCWRNREITILSSGPEALECLDCLKEFLEFGLQNVKYFLEQRR
jgi:hypothetical protein